MFKFHLLKRIQILGLVMHWLSLVVWITRTSFFDNTDWSMFLTGIIDHSSSFKVSTLAIPTTFLSILALSNYENFNHRKFQPGTRLQIWFVDNSTLLTSTMSMESFPVQTVFIDLFICGDVTSWKWRLVILTTVHSACSVSESYYITCDEMWWLSSVHLI